MKQTVKTYVIIESMAKCLPYEDQHVLLAIREKCECFGHVLANGIPEDILATLKDLGLVEGEHRIRLTDFGNEIADYCIC